LTEAAGGGTYEEHPKISWWLWAATGFFTVFTYAIIEMPNTAAKFMWLAIAGLNLAANVMQIRNLSRTRYVLWRRGLSIYSGNNREALIRFDKALAFKKVDRKNRRALRAEIREYGVAKAPRAFGADRWLVIFEREDGETEAVLFDPTPKLETAFRRRLIEADRAMDEEEAGAEPEPRAAAEADQQAGSEADGFAEDVAEGAADGFAEDVAGGAAEDSAGESHADGVAVPGAGERAAGRRRRPE
jgi:hypothetical protein